LRGRGAAQPRSDPEDDRPLHRQGRRAAQEEGAGDPVILSETELFEAVRSQPVPEHVAIIMDGNGRWATRRGLPRVAGHHEGVKAARSVVRAASGLGLRYLTLYAFSTENWSRPVDEVSMLMSLLERSVNAELPDPDLLIRTSGEMRISNFLLWQIAYTELWVTPTLWPDFGAVDLYRAVAEFQGRTRRFGKV